jgi:fatty acid desaturase
MKEIDVFERQRIRFYAYITAISVAGGATFIVLLALAALVRFCHLTPLVMVIPPLMFYPLWIFLGLRSHRRMLKEKGLDIHGKPLNEGEGV